METYSYTSTGCDKVFFCSDTHFWHKNILKYEPVNRPFKDVFEMNEQMISRWNSVVGPNDLVFHLGDFCFGGQGKVMELVSRLNGKIVLILGNHDRDRSKNWWLGCGFHDVISGTIVIDGKFILSHEPIGEDEIQGTIPEGMVNLYGHVHGNPRFNSIDSNRMCVCVERWNCTPISFDFIKEQFKNDPF